MSSPFVPLQKTITLRRGYVDTAGKQHREATLRAPRADDEIKADAEVAALRMHADAHKRAEANSETLQALAMVKQCCVKLGEIVAPSLDVLRSLSWQDSKTLVSTLWTLADEDGRPEETVEGAEGNAPAGSPAQ